MATINKGSFPHPVLGHDDDVDSIFEVINISFTPAVDDIEIKFRVRTNDQDLMRLKNNGSADVLAWWSCPVTMSSGVLNLDIQNHHSDGWSFIGWLDQQNLKENVRVDIQVTANEPLQDHSWLNQHSDYGDSKFSLREGDILAEGGYFEFFTEKLFDPMEPPLGSCFAIVRSNKLQRNLELDFQSDQVLIHIPEAMADGFKGLSSQPEYQISLVVFPALIGTVAFIQRNDNSETDEDLSGLPWYRTVKKLMTAYDDGVADAFLIAQKILDSPYKRIAWDSISVSNEDDQ